MFTLPNAFRNTIIIPQDETGLQFTHPMKCIQNENGIKFHKLSIVQNVREKEEEEEEDEKKDTGKEKVVDGYTAYLMSQSGAQYINLEAPTQIFGQSSIIRVKGQGSTVDAAIIQVMKESHQWFPCSSIFHIGPKKCHSVGKLNSTIFKDHELENIYHCVFCYLQSIQVDTSENKFQCVICTTTYYKNQSIYLECCKQTICKNCRRLTKRKKTCPVHNCPLPSNAIHRNDDNSDNEDEGESSSSSDDE